MSKVLQGVYAYVCNNNYMGECTPADQIYNLSQDMTTAQCDTMLTLAQSVGRVQLDSIFANVGVVEQDDSGTLDYNVKSYSYFPNVNGKSILTAYALRKSLQDINIRGAKEVSHLLVLDRVPNDFYAVDLIDQVPFVTDIPLDSSVAVNKGQVVECVPTQLPIMDTDNFVSHSMRDCINGIDSDKLKIAIDIVDAIITAVDDNKTLYITYDVNDYRLVVDCLVMALKCFPAKLANQLSFITCRGKVARSNANICGIPTNDTKIINSLSNLGYAITVNRFGATAIKGKQKGAFAQMFDKNDELLTKWFDEVKRYEPAVTTVNQLNMVSSLYLNGVCQYDEQADYPSICDNRVAMLIEQLDLISSINGELEYQLNGLEQLLLYLNGSIINYRMSAISPLISRLLQLYSLLKANASMSANRIVEFVMSLVCCMTAQNDKQYQCHYHILSENYANIKQALGDDVYLLAQSIADKWQVVNDYIFSFYRDCEHSTAHYLLLQDLLKYVFDSRVSYNAKYTAMRDTLVNDVFLNYYAGEFDTLLSFVFQSNNTENYVQFEYMLNLFSSNANNEYNNDHIAKFVQYLADNNLLKNAVQYYKTKYANKTVADELLQKLFYDTLARYISSQLTSVANIYVSFTLVQDLLGKIANASTKNIAYFCLYNQVLCPNTDFVANYTDYATLAEQDVANLQSMLDVLKKVRLPDCEQKQQFDSALGSLIDDYHTFMARYTLVSQVVDIRLEFVVRELLLLDRKTIYKLSQKYFAEQLQSSKDDKGTGKIYQQEDFLDKVASCATQFLRTASTAMQQKFSKDVAHYRKTVRKVNYLTALADWTRGLVNSLIFSAVMTAIVALLSYVVYSQIMNNYFVGVFVVISILTFAMSYIVYWDNFKNRRLRNTIVASLWKVCIFIVASLGVYTLTQYLLLTLI